VKRRCYHVIFYYIREIRLELRENLLIFIQSAEKKIEKFRSVQCSSKKTKDHQKRVWQQRKNVNNLTAKFNISDDVGKRKYLRQCFKNIKPCT